MFDENRLQRIREHNKKSSLIIVDHLAYTVRLADFRHLKRAGQAYERSNFYRLPKENFRKYKDVDIKNKLVEDYQKELKHACWVRFTQFLDKICNVRISAPRDIGLHGYTQSYKMLSKDDNSELGMIGFGGNNNTVYVQFSGYGCRYIFQYITPFSLAGWLSDVLNVKTLSRVDLAYDCFDGNYDANYAIKAHKDNAFKSHFGGKQCKRGIYVEYDSDGVVLGETHTFGSRNSNIYWRIYDKAAEQGVGGIWWRSEVELKKVTTDALRAPAEYFASINAFANSFNLESDPKRLHTKRRAVLDFDSQCRWFRRQCGKVLTDLVEVFEGNLEIAFETLCNPDGGKLHFTQTQKTILNKLAREGYIT